MFSGMRRSPLERVITSSSLSFVFIGDLVILKSLMDVFLAAAVVIPFSGVLY